MTRLRGKLKLYALLAPHIERYGAGNSGWTSEIGANKLLRAEREGFHVVMGCNTGFSRRSAGYVGFSDGWQDLMDNFKMDWEFTAAEEGNIALTGEVDLRAEMNSRSPSLWERATKARQPIYFNL